MPLSDFWIVVRWWGTLLLFGAAAYPLTRRLFSSWFDEGYFFDGEDMDLSWQIKKVGYKLIYYPKVSVKHLKGVTKGKVKKWRKKVTLEQRLKLRMAGIKSMERFYRKNLWDQYPTLFNLFVIFGIKIFGVFRKGSIVFSHYTGR